MARLRNERVENRLGLSEPRHRIRAYPRLRQDNQPMSALGQKQTSDWRPLMSALPPKADIGQRDWDVRFVPKAEVGNLANPRSITISSFDVSN
jgi:hypothetical protein